MSTDHIQRLTQANRKLQEQLSEANAENARLRKVIPEPWHSRSSQDSDYDRGYANGWDACRAMLLTTTREA